MAQSTPRTEHFAVPRLSGRWGVWLAARSAALWFRIAAVVRNLDAARSEMRVSREWLEEQERRSGAHSEGP
jgi:hypothetical protein